MTENPKGKSPAVVRPERESNRQKLLSFMKDECKPVKGIFKNFECPGGSVQITQHKYPNQPPFNQVLEDNKEYEVPLWVARWLNGIDITATARNGKIGSCAYPKYNYEIPEGQATPVPMIGEYKQRYGFQSLDFLAA